MTAWGEPRPERLEERITIESDGTVTARSGKVEYGQGIRTGFARIVADELAVAIDRIHVVLGETDVVPWDMGTFGSMSTAVDGATLRRAAAFARTQLLALASRRWDVDAATLQIEQGSIRAPDGRIATYAELVRDNPLRGEVPDRDASPLATALDLPSRFEAIDIVTGRRAFPADLRLPGMLRGHVLHGPRLDARLRSLDERGAGTMPGVVAVIRDGDFVGVVAERDEQARAATAAMHAIWDPPDKTPAQPIPLTLRRDENVQRAFAAAARTFEATYHTPHIAHTALCPSVAVADVHDGGVDLYVATQRPFGLREEAAHVLGVPKETIHVHPQGMGGMFGRGGMNDAPLEALRLSRAVRHPVLLQWTREEEFRLSPARPALTATISAGLDASGRIVAWRSSVETNQFAYVAGAPERVLAETSGRNAVPAYDVGSAEVVLRVRPGAIRTGAFRSLAAAPNIFAIESFMDELATLGGEDPIAFRLRHLTDPRLIRVVETVRDQSSWNDRDGRVLGAACAVYHGTYVAQVVEITIQEDRIRLERAWCAVDAGELVHPDGARNQIEGGIQQAASCAVFEELDLGVEGIRSATWRDYPIATCLDAPKRIDVTFVSSAHAATGIGEPGFVPTAAALANAYFAATAKRLRQLPLTPSSAVCARV